MSLSVWNRGGGAARAGLIAAALAFVSFPLCALAAVTIHDPAAEPLPGVNLASGTFGPDGDRLGRDYIYPSREDIGTYVDRGFKVLRLGFKARRVVTPDGTGGYEPTKDLSLLVDLIDHASTKDASIILDMHDYGKSISGKLIGRDKGATEEFSATWQAIAKAVVKRPNVIFGLMNEPNEQTAKEWLTGANAAISAIRETGAPQLILVPGSYWDGAHSWTKTDNADVMAGVEDPANNIAFEVHQYLDFDNSGTHPSVVRGAGTERLKDFTVWARSQGVRGFLGEFGWAANPAAQREGKALLCHMAVNKDVWLGWSYWAGGPWWGDYMFSIEPKDGIDKPQMRTLREFTQKATPASC